MLPSGATSYSFAGRAYPSVIVRAKDNAVRLPAYRSGALVAPSSATYTLVNSSGTALVSAAACTISASVATYTVLAAAVPATTSPGEGYQERWVFTFAGEAATVEILRPAAVVVAGIYPVISDLDLTAQYFGIENYLSGSLTSFQGSIDEAWGQLMARLVRQGRLPYCIRTPDALREAHLHLTLALIFQGFALSTAGDQWDKKAKDERAAYEKSYQEITVQIDSDQSRLVDDHTRRDQGPTPTMFAPAAGPNRRFAGRV